MTYKGNIINATAPGIIEINGKRVRILESKTHTYKLNKTSISAQGGAQGIMDFLSKCIAEQFGLVWVNAIIEHMERISA